MAADDQRAGVVARRLVVLAVGAVAVRELQQGTEGGMSGRHAVREPQQPARTDLLL